MLLNSVRSEIEDQLGHSVQSASRVSGGSINEAAKIEVSDIGICFLKWNRSADPDMFYKEVKGLQLLSEADSGLRIPEVMLHGTADNQTGFLVLEFIAEGQPKKNSAETFGEQLAALHSRRNDRFGLDVNNYIGKLPQSNRWHKNWIDFFIQERMEPQLDMALRSGKLPSTITKAFEAMYKELPGIFPDEKPSLLHGDLWGGNYFYDTNGKAVIYDPAVYYGHREIEIAFTHLFGGFSTSFYDAYNQTLSIERGFNRRKDIYNLYPLLVHTNLFGGSYARQVEGIVRQFT